MARRSTPHHCAAPGCVRTIPMAMLMCRDHWSRLPAKVQNDVTAAWRDVRMDDWRAACRRAVAWLNANPARVTPAPRWSGIDLSHPEARS